MLKAFVVLTALVAAAQALDPTKYTNFTSLNSNYQLYWRIDGSTAYFGLIVRTAGWIGFGFSEPTVGSMPGADVMISQVINGARTVEDRYTVAFETPLVDTCQNWKLVASETVDGVTSLEISRILDTSDLVQDRPITPGAMKIIYAWGSGNSVAFHSSNVGALTLNLIAPSEPELPDAKDDPNASSFLALMTNAPLITQKTLYMCQAYEIPQFDTPHHVIEVDFVLDPNTSQFVHHSLIHLCDNRTGGYVQTYPTAAECVTPVGNPYSGCTTLLYAWAPGIGSFKLPREAGYRIGQQANSAAFIIIEIHYNNAKAGYFDNSGARIWHTPFLREFDAGTLTIGDPLLNFPPIEPNVVLEHYEAECPSRCTSKLPRPIRAFASFQHAHMVGQQLWTSHWDENGARIGSYFDRIEYYDYNFQSITKINATINPGDRLNTHCTFTTTDRTTATRFYFGSEDEMCMTFVSYYPVVQVDSLGSFAYCGKSYAGGTVCGSTDSIGGEGQLAYRNPTIFDPVEDRQRVFGSVPRTCPVTDDTAPSNKPLSTAAIAGIVVGSVAGFALLAVVIYVVVNKYKGPAYAPIPTNA